MSIKNYKLVGKEPVECPFDEITPFDQRTICRDTFGDVLVSTVFLTFDHSFSGIGPILFETMIFNGEYDSYQERYKTYDEAVEGHNRACYLVNKISIDRNNKLNNLGIFE